MFNISAQNIVLLVILFFVGVIVGLSRLSNRQVRRYYNKVASYMHAVNIAQPGVFSYGKVTGFYKGKRFEWKVFPVYRDRGTHFHLEVKMPLDYPMEEKDKTIHVAENVSIRDNNVSYDDDYRFTFNMQDIPKIFEEVYAALEKRDHDLVFKCLECGQEIKAKEDKCPKCGWTWKE